MRDATAKAIRVAVRAFVAVLILGWILLWALGHYRPGYVEFHRWTVRAGGIDWLQRRVQWSNGTLVFDEYSEAFAGDNLEEAAQMAATTGDGWKPVFESGSSPHAGFRFDYAETDNPVWKRTARLVAFPCWLPVLVTGAWPACTLARLGWRHRRARRRHRAGRCIACGYDLRALPAPGPSPITRRCPECGTCVGSG